MTQSEAKELVEKISSAFANSRFDTIKRQTYVEAFEKLDQATTALSIKKLILTNKFSPTVAEIFEMYQMIKRSEKRYIHAIKQPKVACKVCDGDGLLVKPRTEYFLEYDYLYHCECAAGRLCSYDGRTISENRSDFFIAPIAQYYLEQRALIVASTS